MSTDIQVENGEIIIWGERKLTQSKFGQLPLPPVTPVLRKIWQDKSASAKWLVISPKTAARLYNDGILLKIHLRNAKTYTIFETDDPFTNGSPAICICLSLDGETHVNVIILKHLNPDVVKLYSEDLHLLKRINI